MTEYEEFLDKKKRDSCAERLFHVVGDETLVKQLEQSIFEYAVSKAENRGKDEREAYFLRIYLNKTTSLYTNFNEEGSICNTNLIGRFKSGELDPKRAAFYSPQELFPEHWDELLKKKSAQNDFLYMKQPEIVTDQFQCGRCKEWHCTYYSMQTASCDEPARLFITCLNCGHRF